VQKLAELGRRIVGLSTQSRLKNISVPIGVGTSFIELHPGYREVLVSTPLLGRAHQTVVWYVLMARPK